MKPSPLLPHQAESEALKLKWVMREGKWIEAPHVLTRGPNGQLSDRPATTNETSEQAA